MLLLSGETDWKVIGIDVNDELADKLNSKYFNHVYLKFNETSNLYLCLRKFVGDSDCYRNTHGRL